MSNFLASFHFLQSPALRVIFFFVAGLLLGYTHPLTSFYALLGIGAVFVALWIYFQEIRKQKNLLLHFAAIGVLFLAGAFWSSWHYDRLSMVRGNDEQASCLLIETSPSQVRSGFRLKASVPSKEDAVPSSVLLYVPHLPNDSVAVGDTIYTSIERVYRLDQVRKEEYRNFLLARECGAAMYVDTIFRHSKATTFNLRRMLTEQRQRLLGTLDSLSLSELQKEALGAMTLGHRTNEGKAESLFRKTGVVHILSVSGFHLAVVALAVSFLCSLFYRVARWRYWSIFVQIVVAWLFVALTGFSAPAVRAAVMLSLYQLSFLLGRSTCTMNVIAFSALLLLLYNPSYVLDIGFQLSYAAVFSIVLFHPLFMQSLPPIGSSVARYLYQGLVLSLSAQFFTIPLCLYHFGETSLLSLWSNVPLVLLSTLLIPITLVYMLFASWGLESLFLKKGVELLSAAMEWLLDLFASIQNVELHSSISGLQCLSLYSMIMAIYLLWSYGLYKKRRRDSGGETI